LKKNSILKETIDNKLFLPFWYSVACLACLGIRLHGTAVAGSQDHDQLLLLCRGALALILIGKCKNFIARGHAVSLNNIPLPACEINLVKYW
jgi:hypothetical protein